MKFSEFLINESMPEGYKFSGTVDKKSMTKNLIELARDKPDLYSQVVSNLKQTGDMLATQEGLSVGLDDITPDYKSRDKIIREGQYKFKKAKNRKEEIDALLWTQNKGLDFIKDNQGSLGRQVTSGSRGKPGQLLKTIFSPVVVKGDNDVPQPYLIDRSYSEGLRPSQFWIATGESRQELATTQLATAIPGDTSKQMASALNSSTITKEDCGTRNGIPYNTSDHHILGRYEAGTNKLIDDSYVRTISRNGDKEVIIRSPMTCREHPGSCQKCYGLDLRGQKLEIGTNVGLRAAQSMSEPLTQMVLSSKHGGQMAKSEDPELRGTMGFRQLLDVPKMFKDKAVLSSETGVVGSITNAPQGGSRVWIGDVEHYVEPSRKVTVRKGEKVRIGDKLSDGIINPKELVESKGLGEGRRYLNKTIQDIYMGSGVDMDRRHIELLTKQDLNFAKVDHGDTGGKFIRGDVVPYNNLRSHIEKRSESLPVSKDLLGRQLGEEFYYHSVGTKITEEVLVDLIKAGKSKVMVQRSGVQFTPIMRPLEQIPLINTDWVTRLSHRKLKNTLLEGAAQGWSSELNGDAPYPPIIFN